LIHIIATEGDFHFQSWKERLSKTPESLPDDASIKVKMAFKLQTAIGPAIYSQGKCTAKPVIGTIKESLGFGQFSSQGLAAAADKWNLVYLAFNLKRLLTLTNRKLCLIPTSLTAY